MLFSFILMLMSTTPLCDGFLVRGLVLNIFDNYEAPESHPESTSTTSTSTSTTLNSTTFSTFLFGYYTPSGWTGLRWTGISNYTTTPSSYSKGSDSNYSSETESKSNVSSKGLKKNVKRMDSDKRLSIYGNQSFINLRYKYVYPIVLGVCLGTTILLVLVLGIQFRQGTRMARSTLLILIAIATADVITMGSSVAEISYLYKSTGENHGFLPFSSCKIMYILERLSAVPHAISVWLTVVLSCQRWLCVAMPLTTRQFVNIRCSVISVTLTLVTVTAFHVYRFFDRVFLKVTIPANFQFGKQIETCRSAHADWVGDRESYEQLFMWGRIVVANLLPSILIVTFVTMMVREILKTDTILLQANKDNVKTRTDRRRLSVIVVIIALIVVGVELSTGMLMSLYALKISTKLFIISVETFQAVAFVFDIILYVSYFVIFLIYCLMSKGIREKVVSIFMRCWPRGHRPESETASSFV